MAAIKRSISLQDRLFSDAERRMEELRLSSFSDYVQRLIREDTERIANPSLVAEDAGKYQGGRKKDVRSARSS